LAGSGYCPCRCRDCFEVAIKSAHERDAFCHACVTAGCEEGEHECAARDLRTETRRDDVSMQMEYAYVEREAAKCARQGCGHARSWHHLDWDPVHCTFTGLDESAFCDCPVFVEPEERAPCAIDELGGEG
jgi:hypothetical protein